MRKLHRFYLFTLAATLCSSISFGQTAQEKENIIVQMNYCINSLTNIANNQSMTILTYESDQILNNLKIIDIRGEHELQNFRSELFDAIRNLQITEQEKDILKRVQDLKSKNLMWKSLSGALNPSMLITGGGNIGPQIAFQAIVTAARTAVDYQATKGENEIDELQAMWALKKKELEKIGELRSNALKITFSLYDKYHFLGEWDRLTEETAKQFNDIINEPKASKRARLLKENEKKFGMLPDYYYYLGLAYLGDDAEGKDANYKLAQPYLNKYLEKYNRTPIFRYDQKSGIIALTRLAHEQNLPSSKKEELIQTALKNLPNNGAALLQCALVYILELNEKDKGFALLRSGLDNNYSNKDAILSTITFYLDDIKKHSSNYNEIIAAVNDCQSIGLNEYIPFVIANNLDSWSTLGNIMSVTKGPEINIKQNRHFDCSGVKTYRISSSGLDMDISQQNLIPDRSFTYKELTKKVDAFAVKGNENLMFAFVEPVIYGERYAVKNNLDYNKLRKGEFQGSNVFTITDSDINDIVKFCEKNESGESGMKITCKDSKVIVKADDVAYSLADQYYLPKDEITSMDTGLSLKKSDFCFVVDYEGKDSLSFIPTRLESMTGDYLAIDFGDIKHTIVTYKEDGSEWNLYSIERDGVITFKDTQPVLDPKRDGTMTKLWKDAKSTASHVADKVGKTTSSVASTVGNKTSNIWEWIKGMFTSGNESKDARSEEPEKKESKQDSEEKSFLDKVMFWKK